MVDVWALPSEDKKLGTFITREKITHDAHYSVFVVPPVLKRDHVLSFKTLPCTTIQSTSTAFYIVIMSYRPRKERQPRYCPEEILYERVQSILMF